MLDRMKGLLLRLSAVDADSEAAVRVIAYFDALVDRGATLVQLVRATAALAECPAGLSRPGAETLRIAPDGRNITSHQGIESSGVDVDRVGRLWLERSGGPATVDDLVLERASISARLLSATHQHSLFPRAGDTALVDLVMAGDESADDRTHALRLLGVGPDVSVRVIVLDSGSDEAIADAAGLVARTTSGRVAGAREIGSLSEILFVQHDGVRDIAGALRAAQRDDATWDGIRVGIGRPCSGLEACNSLNQAQIAFRFAVAGGGHHAVVDHMTLGSLALLAELPRERLLAEPDIAQLVALADTYGGRTDVQILETYCRTGSLRQAALVLHMHHSSVATRIANIARALGWTLDDPDGLLRARIALTGRRLAANC